VETIIGSIGGETDIMNSWIKIDDSSLAEFKNAPVDLDKKGKIIGNQNNILKLILNPVYAEAKGIISGKFFYDTCSHSIKFLGTVKGEDESLSQKLRLWNDSLTNILGMELHLQYGIAYVRKRIEECISYIAYKRNVNLPALYIKSLKYDGGSYIEKLLPKYLGAEDNELNKWIMKHFMVGLVKRVLNPGCKFDEIMVLTGDQGIGKTSFIEKLAINPSWYCSLNSIKGKDAVSNLTGKIVVELEEFVALRNAKSADEAKLFISSRISTVRLPFERTSRDIPRTCILIATTNDATFLGDFSGERRYLPVKVNQENIQIPAMYDPQKFPQIKSLSKEDHALIVERDFKGAMAEAYQAYLNDEFQEVLPSHLFRDLALVIQEHKLDNRHVQNFLEFLHWKESSSDTPDILCSAEFTNRYPDANEKVFSELMANEMRGVWKLTPSTTSVKRIIDGRVRVTKKFYERIRKEEQDSPDY